jgi:hypothetical protein
MALAVRVNGSKKVARGLVVARCGSAELLEFSEERLDQVVLFAENADHTSGTVWRLAFDGNDGCFAGGYGMIVCAEQHRKSGGYYYRFAMDTHPQLTHAPVLARNVGSYGG